jgi:hypothetical protein
MMLRKVLSEIMWIITKDLMRQITLPHLQGKRLILEDVNKIKKNILKIIKESF